VESERRLFYVGITRARTACFVGCGADNDRSRFLKDALGQAEARPTPARAKR
jgi:superfamily I DNA/RNA helicase